MSKRILALPPMWARMEGFREFLAGEEDVDVGFLSEGEGIIKNRQDAALAAAESIRKVKEAEAAGYKAVVCCYHVDPNIEAVREAVKIP